MSDDAAQAIRSAIAERGPITFAEFMELALYGPGAFYDRPPVGERGEFITSPHVHPVFAALLARGLTQMWQELGRPDPFPLVELGAGDGTLAARLLEQLAGVPVEYEALERSGGAREALRKLPVRVHATLDEVARPLAGCVIANELLDNVPFHRLRRRGDTFVEVRVDLDGSRFVEVEAPASAELLELVPSGDWTERVVSPEAVGLIEAVAKVLARGYAIFIDYEQGSNAHVHGYRGHRVEGSVLEDPGSSDVTAGVDFDVIARTAEGAGLDGRVLSQEAALRALGFMEWFEGERTRQVRELSGGSGAEAVRAWSGRNAAMQLIDPSGLGALRWLVLKTRECEWPAFVADAAG